MKYYILSFQNVKTGETKEYYKYINSGKNIKDIAIDLANKFEMDKEETRIHIYKLEKVIYNGEY